MRKDKLSLKELVVNIINASSEVSDDMERVYKDNNTFLDRYSNILENDRELKNQIDSCFQSHYKFFDELKKLHNICKIRIENKKNQ